MNPQYTAQILTRSVRAAIAPLDVINEELLSVASAAAAASCSLQMFPTAKCKALRIDSTNSSSIC
jgi:hypothetical protein